MTDYKDIAQERLTEATKALLKGMYQDNDKPDLAINKYQLATGVRLSDVERAQVKIAALMVVIGKIEEDKIEETEK